MRKLCALLLLVPLQLAAIDFVTIDNPGNPSSSIGKGSVSYLYQISKYEITNSEYCLFLNSVASNSDKYELFSPLMQEHFFGGIIRIQERGAYFYRTKEGYENTPVVGITWMSAVRYINWLHYNSANIEHNVPIESYSKQTEGDDIYGAYDTRSIPTMRNANARYWLPNEDEWLKACYFNGICWDETLIARGSNCYTSEGWAYPYPHIKQVGKDVSPSHYGTFDQQGNAAEWIENSRGGDDKWKLAEGGSLIRPVDFARFGVTEGDFPNKSITTFGIRICRLSDHTTLLSEVDEPVVEEVVEHTNAFKCDRLGNEYVLVGDAGNAGDVVNQYKGRVNYDYYIARTELSNASYCNFLNSVAKYDDPFGLYDENMNTGACGFIVRKKAEQGYEYFCKQGGTDLPVVYVNYYDIVRYANWMHYGCPSTGKCELGTTEGTETQGAYDTSDFEDVRSGRKQPYESFGKRNQGARFWIPDENEWYKAAYYDPKKIDNRKYHDYPTRSSDAPTLQQANYMVNNHFAVGEPFYVAPVTSYQNSHSYYGTLQQGGNVWEWIEDWQYGIVGSRGLRGGSWSYTSYGLNACNTDPGGLDNSGYVFGARLCMATSDAGWHLVKTPLLDRFYESILLMPRKHLVLAAILAVLLSIFGIICTIIVMLHAFRKILIK